MLDLRPLFRRWLENRAWVTAAQNGRRDQSWSRRCSGWQYRPSFILYIAIDAVVGDSPNSTTKAEPSGCASGFFLFAIALAALVVTAKGDSRTRRLFGICRRQRWQHRLTSS
jgi:hypothetical protein